jgi:signal-transduction protein with cAMP-binding, CBS, and nucleotidyltransferase domain
MTPEKNGQETSGAYRAGLTQDHRVSDVVRDVMSPCPRGLGADATVLDAALVMQREDIGDVLVMDQDDRLLGIVTDRDIVVRALAGGRDPAATRIADVCSRELTTIGPDDSVGGAVRLMREKAIRRLPVVEHGQVVGMLTIGDIAIERDSRTALADISAAPPNS